MSASFERRQFLKLAALFSGGVSTPAAAAREDAGAVGASSPAMAASASGDMPVRWLEGLPASFKGTTWGVSWPQGSMPRDSAF